MKNLFLSLVLFMFFTPAFAQDLSGDILLRIRTGYSSMSNDLSFSDTDLEGNFDISGSFTADIDATYFFTNHLAAELSMGVSKHDLSHRYFADLGYFHIFTTSLNMQYHFPVNAFKPYVGAGIDYGVFFAEGEHPSTTLFSQLRIENTFGFNLQGGVDYMVNEKWWINADIRYRFLPGTNAALTYDKCVFYYKDASAKQAAVPCPDPVRITAESDTGLQQFFAGIGVGYRFGK